LNALAALAAVDFYHMALDMSQNAHYSEGKRVKGRPGGD
jgi:hypothetical protein